ncbi:MAG: GAF domain-containing protein, partial [Erysipelotrichaceae bacterium]|nr:GAF domain-containing protein [Erysipelotrichaceae bacterium]
NHPGGCSLFRFDNEDSSVVTAFDFNHKDGYDEKLAQFAKGANVMIYDGMFSNEEYIGKEHWGHSTPEMGAKIGLKAGVEKVYITHYGMHTDDELSEQETEIRKTYPFVSYARCGMHKSKFRKVLEVGSALSSEKDNNKLLNSIILAAMDITGADAGTLYLLEDEVLKFRIMITRSKNYYKGLDGEKIDMPPVKLDISNVCAASVIERKTINIPDVYRSDQYDFSGPRNYDKINNYKTTSALVVPMTNDYNEVIGVIQLINATDAEGNVIAFSNEDVSIIEALSSQTAITLTNIGYANQINELLFGFVRVIVAGIDQITPYNANHTRNMVKYGALFFDYQEKINGPYEVDLAHKREILASIWLHDIGKLITPLEVMNKNTRLGENGLERLENRFGRISLLLKLDLVSGKLSEKEYEERKNKVDEYLSFIERLNSSDRLSDEDEAMVKEIAGCSYTEENGDVRPYLDEDEIEHLLIRNGTLTAGERQIMEGHVSMTSKMLSGLEFPRGFKNVPFFAGSHHEYLNGKGYPNHLTAEDLPWQVRLITIIDVFEALTAKDRPYKEPMLPEKAFAILYEKADLGQIDREILDQFRDSKVWE